MHFLSLQIFEEHDKTEAKNLKESSISALAKIKTIPTRIAVETGTVLYNRYKEKYTIQYYRKIIFPDKHRELSIIYMYINGTALVL